MLPVIGVADLEPGDLVGVADAPLLRVPLGALQHTTHAAGAHPGQTSDSQVSAVARSPDTDMAAPTVPSPSPAQMERLNPAKRSAFLCVWARIPPHLRKIASNYTTLAGTPRSSSNWGMCFAIFLACFPPRRRFFGLAP